MEDVLAIIFIFGGAAITLVAYSPIGKAFAARIRGETQELADVHERLDFTERLVASRTEPASLKQPEV